MFPSSTAPLKNHATLLEAMALLPECRLVCPWRLGSRRPADCSPAPNGPTCGAWSPFPGFVSTEDLASLYARASAVVVPSLWEAASGAMLEAFSWGVPGSLRRTREPLLAQLDFTGADAAVFRGTRPRLPSLRPSGRVHREREHYARASRAAGALLAARTWQDTAADDVAVLDWVRAGRPGPMPRSSFAETLLTSRGPLSAQDRYPVARPCLSDLEERFYLVDAYRSGWISSQGPYLRKFEEQFAARRGATAAVATGNGTVAIHLVLAAAGIGPGDEGHRSGSDLHRHRQRGDPSAAPARSSSTSHRIPGASTWNRSLPLSAPVPVPSWPSTCTATRPTTPRSGRSASSTVCFWSPTPPSRSAPS